MLLRRLCFVCQFDQTTKAGSKSVRQCRALGWHDPPGKTVQGPQSLGELLTSHLHWPHVPHMCFSAMRETKGGWGRSGKKEEVDDAKCGREKESVWWEESEQVGRPSLASPRSLSKGRTCFAQTSCCHYGRRRRWRRRRPWWWRPTRRLEFWQ